MEHLVQLAKGSCTSNRNLRSALQIVGDVLKESDGEKRLCNAMFGVDGRPFSIQFVSGVLKRVNNRERFKENVVTTLCERFWASESPNMGAALNGWLVLGREFFSRHEKEFLTILHKHVEQIPLDCFKPFAKMIDDFLNMEFCYDELPNLFDNPSKYSVVASCVVRVVGRLEGDVIALPAAMRLLASCLMAFSGENLTRNMELVAKQTDRMLLLEAEVTRLQRCHVRGSEISVKVEQTEDHRPTDVIFKCIIVQNILPLLELERGCRIVAGLIIKCYNTGNRCLRASIEAMFEAAMKLAKKEGKLENAHDLFRGEFDNVPMQASLMKMCLPVLCSIRELDESKWNELCDVMKDPQSTGYVARIAPKSEKFAQFLLRKAEEDTHSVSDLQPLSHGLKRVLNNIGIDRMLRMTEDATGFHKCWFTLEISLAVPGLMDVEILRSCYMCAGRSYNWDIRTRYVQSFAVNGFPKDLSDEEMFVGSLKSLLLIDSEVHQSHLVTSFKTIFCSKVDERFARAALECAKMLVSVDYCDFQRGFGEEMVEILRKRIGRATHMREERTRPKLRSFSLTDLIEFRGQMLGVSWDEEVAKQIIEHLKDESSPKVELELVNLAAMAVASMPANKEYARNATYLTFAKLVASRSTNFITGTYDAFSKMLGLCTDDVCSRLASEFVEVMHNFDMGSMRRSASLPFLAVAISHTSDENGMFLLDRVIKMAQETEDSELTANLLNVLRRLLIDTELDAIVEVRYGEIFEVLFKHARSPSWDVVSAVNLMLVTVCRKVLSSFDHPNSVLLEQLAFKIAGSREVLLRALNDDNCHCTYLALMTLTMVVPRRPDTEMARLASLHLGSRNIRVRRMAARVVAAMSAGKVDDSITCIMEQQDARCKANLRNGLSLLRREMGENDPEPDILARVVALKERLIRPELSHVTPGYALDGFKFLVKHANSIEYIGILVGLIKSVQSVYLKAEIINYLAKATDPREAVQELAPLFLDFCLDGRDEVVPVLCAISKLSGHIIKIDGGWKIVLMLSVSDIPLVRTNVCKAVNEQDVPTEYHVIHTAVSHLSDDARRFMCDQWIQKLELHSQSVARVQPLTIFVNEFFVLNLLIPEASAYYSRELKDTRDLESARTKFIAFCRESLFCDK